MECTVFQAHTAYQIVSAVVASVSVLVSRITTLGACTSVGWFSLLMRSWGGGQYECRISECFHVPGGSSTHGISLENLVHPVLPV